MALFGRRRRDATPPTNPIADFWGWWSAEGRTLVTSAIDAGEPQRMVEAVSARVGAIHPDLAWETGKGTTSAHLFLVGSDGDATLRPLAERWLRSAPAADETWSFAAARQRDDGAIDGRLGIGDVELTLSEVRAVVSYDADRFRFDVVLTHPVFAQVPEQVRIQVMFLTADWLLGEDDVERWIGSLETSGTPRDDSVTLQEFRDLVDERAGQTLDETWALLSGTSDSGTRALASVRRPLRWIDHPLLDQHAVVVLPFDARDDGQPTPESLEILRTFEDALEATIGHRGLVAAHETSDGARRMHVYLDGEDQNAADLVTRATAAHPGASVRFSSDPAWKELGHLL